MLAIKLTENMGRGVFAQRSYKTGELVESNHVIVIEGWERGSLSKTILNTYVFGWPDSNGRETLIALALGYGSIFNHSQEYNLTYKASPEEKTINFYATNDINIGDQLFIDYGYEPEQGIRVYQTHKKNYGMPESLLRLPQLPDIDTDKSA